MVSKEYPHIGEKVYHAGLPNDLHIYVDWRSEFWKSYAFFAISYGGMDIKFRLNGQWRDTPAGVARFLEHKMLDIEDSSAFQDPVTNGVSPNAFASSALAGYYFESTEEFYDNLKILLSPVSIPWFTRESVDREQRIISQEICMVKDDPGNQVFYGLMKCLFDHHPIRVPITDTQESISHIIADIFYACHKVFYTLSNVVFTVMRSVEPEEIVRITRGILPREPSEHIKWSYGGEEDGAAAEPRKELRMEVSTPVFRLGFKAEPVPAEEGRLHCQLMSELTCEALLGNSSPLYARLYSESFINKNFGCGFELYPGCVLVTADGEGYDPHAMWDAVLVEGAHITQESADEDLFHRLKKGVYGAKVWGLNSFENMYIELAQAHFTGMEYLILPEVLDSISKTDVENYIRRWVTPERYGLVMVRPGERAWWESSLFPAWV